MKPTEYARIAAALGISTSEAAELEAEWRDWGALQLHKQEKRQPTQARYAQH